MVRLALVAGILGMAVAGFVSCGGSGEDSCASKGGVICTNCSSAGDCDMTCGAGESEYCVGLEYFGADNPDELRCTFCE